MATSGAEKAFCVLEFDKNKCSTHVQGRAVLWYREAAASGGTRKGAA
jgi:hypothetical protein